HFRLIIQRDEIELASLTLIKGACLGYLMDKASIPKGLDNIHAKTDRINCYIIKNRWATQVAVSTKITQDREITTRSLFYSVYFFKILLVILFANGKSNNTHR